ncbi:MAG: xanthine dehydrogenase family protein subunit M [Pseudomonadota bacterium]
MTLPRFTYLSPRSLREASALLAAHGDKARLMAGGTDLLIRMSHRAMTPEFVIGLGRLPGLDYLRFDPDKGLSIGALAKLSGVAESSEVNRYYPALAQSAAVTATVQIRNMGTVVGNICNAAPSADNACPLLVHDAEVLAAQPGGERIIPLDEFFRGPGLTALEPGEIVKEIRLPAPGRRTASNYQKISARSKVDIAATAVAALIGLDEEGLCSKARIALGAVGPTPLRARRAEKILEGRAPSPELIAQAGAAAAEESSPISDVRASAGYRKAMVEVLTKRALTAAAEAAGKLAAGCEI